MFGVWIVFIAFCFVVLGFLPKRIKYSAFVVLLAISACPIFEQGQYNAIDLLYAFFDVPSVFGLMVALAFVIEVILSDVALKYQKIAFISKHLKVKPITFVLYGVFGLVVYLGGLNLISFDIYHLTPLWQGLIIFGMACVMIIFDKVAGILLAISFVLMLVLDSSFVEMMFCAYLWLFSVVYSFYILVCLIVESKRKSIKQI